MQDLLADAFALAAQVVERPCFIFQCPFPWNDSPARDPHFDDELLLNGTFWLYYPKHCSNGGLNPRDIGIVSKLGFEPGYTDKDRRPV